MKYDLSGKYKKIEFDIFIEAINSNKLQYFSEYGQDFNLDDTIVRYSEKSTFDGEKKFDIIVNNVIKKLELLKIKFMLNKTVNIEKYESRFREYETPHYSYDFLMTDPKFEFRYAHLSYEERAFCSLELVFLMMMHNKNVNIKILSNIFGFEVTFKTWNNIRNDISKILNCKIEKNKNGRYKIIKEKYEL